MGRTGGDAATVVESAGAPATCRLPAGEPAPFANRPGSAHDKPRQVLVLEPAPACSDAADVEASGGSGTDLHNTRAILVCQEGWR